MQMLYNSDSFTVVQIELPPAPNRLPTETSAGVEDNAAQPGRPTPEEAGSDAPGYVRGGFEIVDKAARREIFIEGLLAERFRQGVQRLVEAGQASEEDFDDYIARFANLAQHPLVLH